MNETLTLKENKRFSEEQQIRNEVVIGLIYFIIQAVVIPILYMNNTMFQNSNIINSICVVGIIYYLLKQIFFSESDGIASAIGFCILSIVWLVSLSIIGKLMLNNIEIFNQNQFEQNIGLVCKIVLVNIGIIVGIFFISLVQEYIQDQALNQKLKGYKQKTNQIEKINIWFISIVTIIVGLMVAVSLLATQTITGINWEKFIINVGILYGTITLGILVR